MIDSAYIYIKAGNGGNGSAALRREKWIPMGGPWGGDGAKGGDVIVVARQNINTLTSFRYQKHYKAEDGGAGDKKLMRGKGGKDMIIELPIGTSIYNEEKELILDLTEADKEFLLEKGGMGGFGNWHFKSPSNQAPKFAKPGIKTEQKTIYLELKILADVGIVGLPSSGKTSLINTLTNVNAKTADYHFTTLEPNIGVLDMKTINKKIEDAIVIADIPGLIEGASEGKGLGFDFLKHIERTKVLLHLIDGLDAIKYNTEQLLKNYFTVNNELKKWNKDILKKPEFIAINKIDITEVKEKQTEIEKIFKAKGLSPVFISAYNQTETKELFEEIYKAFKKQQLAALKKEKIYSEENAIKVFTIENLPNKRIIFKNTKTHEQEDVNEFTQ